MPQSNQRGIEIGQGGGGDKAGKGPQSNQRGIEMEAARRRAQGAAAPQSNQRGIEILLALLNVSRRPLLNRTSVGLKWASSKRSPGASGTSIEPAWD